MTRAAELRQGWKVLLTTCLGLGFGLSGIPFYSFSLFPPELATEFPGWSLGSMGVSVAVVTFMQFLTGPIAGRLMDRHGVRRLLIPSAVLFAVAMAAMTLVRGQVWVLWLGYVVMALAGMFTTSVAYSRVIVTWFDQMRGLALGITMAGSAVVAMILPRLLMAAMADGGWRAGYLACAALALVPLPMLLIFLREHTVDAAEGTVGRPMYGHTLGVAVRQRPFIIMVVAAALYSPGIQSVVTHLATILTDAGLPRGELAGTLAFMGIGILLGRFVAGVTLDTFRHRPAVATILFLTPALSFALFGLQSAQYAWLAVLLLGMSVGIEGDVFGYMTSRYFGMRSYAELFGWIFGVMCIMGAVGPLFVLALETLYAGDTVAALHTAIRVYFFLFLASAALMYFIGPYPNWDAAADNRA